MYRPLQFYWQDYSNKGYMTALRYLQDLQAEGLITTLGIVNFDAVRTDEICTQLGPGAIVSNQVQVCTRIYLSRVSKNMRANTRPSQSSHSLTHARSTVWQMSARSTTSSCSLMAHLYIYSLQPHPLVSPLLIRSHDSVVAFSQTHGLTSPSPIHIQAR